MKGRGGASAIYHIQCKNSVGRSPFDPPNPSLFTSSERTLVIKIEGMLIKTKAMRV